MPIYQFYCPDNNKLYSFYARTLAYADKTPRCPDNAQFRMEREISPFAVTGRAKEKPEGGDGPDLEDPRMAAAFSEMEREFAGINEDNPDPRMLARMMRKMSAITGEKIPGQMEEMIRRMEAGEDPEKLEDEYGDALGDFDGGEAGDAEAGEQIKEQLRAIRKRPRRDPALYEMREFVD